MSTVTYVGDGDVLWIEGHFLESPDRGPAKIHVADPAAAAYMVVGPFAGDVPGPGLANVYWHDEVLDVQGRTTVGVHTLSPAGSADPQHWSLLENVRLSDYQQTPLEVTAWQTTSRPFQVRVTLPSSCESTAELDNVVRDFLYVRELIPTVGSLAATTSPIYDFEMPTYGDGLRLSLMIHPVGSRHTHWYVERMAIPSASTSIIERDLTNVLLPEVTSLTVTPAPDRPVIEWTVGAGDAEDTVGVGVAEGAFQWSLVLPAGVRRVQLPELPTDVAHDFSSLPATNVSVSLGEASDFTSYADVRRHSTEMMNEVRAAGTRIRISSRGYGPF